MPLKDLIAAKSTLAEDAIESIVKDYVRYDVEEKEIGLTPAASRLAGKAKILIYLVALQGWPIVVEDEAIPTEAKPGHIGDRVGIHGGTLRPFLKDLKDRHLIIAKNGAYSVRAASLDDIRVELERAGTTTRPKPRRAARRRTNAEPEEPGRPSKVRRKSSAGRGRNLSVKFKGWIDEGFFDKPRTLADVQERFHQEGDIIPQTSVPSYLLAAVRAKRLARQKAEVNRKTVWVYQRIK